MSNVGKIRLKTFSELQATAELKIRIDKDEAKSREDIGNRTPKKKLLRASMRYPQKISREKKRSGSAGGSFVPGPKANDDYDFASEMIFLPDLSDKRRTTKLPKPPKATTSSEMFEQELQLQKGIEDMEKESSCSYSYKPSTKRRKTAAAESCAAEKPVSQTTNVPSLVTYWAEIMKELPQELKDEAEERVTKLLWDFKRRAKNYE